MSAFIKTIRDRYLPTAWPALLFLVLLINVKLVVKVAVIVIMAIVFFKSFRIKPFRPYGPSLFYAGMPILAIIVAVLSGNIFANNYSVVLLTGTGFWLMALLAFGVVQVMVNRYTTAQLHQAIFIFFLLNLIVSLWIYAGIVWETGTLNPYRYQGQFQKYFIGTGDYIKGLSFDTATTNAVVCAMGVLYFLYRQRFLMVIASMVVFLMTGSNIMNLMLMGLLLLVFILQSNRVQKSMIVVCGLLLLVFWTRVSPQNSQYFIQALQRLNKQEMPVATTPASVLPLQQQPDSLLSMEERKEKIAILYLDSMSRSLQARRDPDQPAVAHVAASGKPLIPTANIHAAPYQHRSDTNATELEMLRFVTRYKTALSLAPMPIAYTDKPGKWRAMEQTVDYLSAHPLYWIRGAGMGNFSSKLAFRASALHIAGGFPEQYQYIHPAFLSHHLDLYLHYFTRSEGLHSATNSPNSIYTQLLAEYGLVGLAGFLWLYLFFFARQYRLLSYGRPLLLLIIGIGMLDYWFEQLSVLPLAELLLLLNAKEGREGHTT
jgi:hypothetical protein